MSSNAMSTFEELDAISQPKIEYSVLSEIKKPTSSFVLSFLINLGFISLESDIFIFPKIGEYTKFNSIDNRTDISTLIPITIYQYIRNDKTGRYEFGYRNSPLLDYLKNEIMKYNSDLFKFTIESPSTVQFSTVSDSIRFIYVLNEDNAKIDFDAKDFPRCKCFISISPIHSDNYIFHIHGLSQHLFPEFFDTKLRVCRPHIGFLLPILSVLQRSIDFHLEHPSDSISQHPSDGVSHRPPPTVLPTCFSKGYKGRKKLIGGYFSEDRTINIQEIIKQLKSD